MILAEIIGPDLLIILAIVALLFGSSQLPKLARSLGEARSDGLAATFADARFEKIAGTQCTTLTKGSVIQEVTRNVTERYIVNDSTNATIAIMDTGIDSGHPDLNVVNSVGQPFGFQSGEDGNGHGTHVAGIAAAVTNNGIGVAGTAPRARIILLQLYDPFGGRRSALRRERPGA